MSGRVALITGCGKKGGIGAAAARTLGASGITVLATSVAPSNIAAANNVRPDAALAHRSLEALVDEIVSAGGKASWAQGDVSNEADAAYMVGEALKRYGRLDILVNNAGAPKGRDRADIEQVPLEAWEQQMAVNARGVFLMCRAAVTPMRKQGWGRIINISSSSVKVGGKHQAVYAASKAAVLGFTRSLAVELAPDGITINDICPYSIFTDRALESARLAAGTDDAAAVEAALAQKAKAIPVGRHGRPEEVAGMIAYLASESSAFVTGQSISICGGTT